MARTTGKIRCGPTEQLAPRTATPSGVKVLTTSAGVSPEIVRPSSAKVIKATIGKSLADLAASRAAVISSRLPIVSTKRRSTPPSSRASTCSA
jgi:hypothetical protein